RGFCRGVLVAHECGPAPGDAKALAPAADIGGIGGAMGAAARGGMIMPGPARGHVDLKGDLAAQAFSGGGLAGRDSLGFFLWWFVFFEHRGPRSIRRRSGMVRRTRPQMHYCACAKLERLLLVAAILAGEFDAGLAFRGLHAVGGSALAAHRF